MHVERTEFLIADQSKDAQDLMIDYLGTTEATGELPSTTRTPTRERSNRAGAWAPLDERGGEPAMTAPQPFTRHDVERAIGLGSRSAGGVSPQAG